MKAIAAGGKHSLSLRADGTVWAWGATGHGQVGSGWSKADRLTPVQVSEPENGAVEPGGGWWNKAIAAGGTHSLAIRSDGTVWAWGANDRGQLGDNSTSDSVVPVNVLIAERVIEPTLAGVTAIAAGDSHSIAVGAVGVVNADGGFVHCWGANDEGQLGDKTTMDKNAAVAAWFEHGPALRKVVSIGAGSRHSLAVGPSTIFDQESWLRDHDSVRKTLFWEKPDPQDHDTAGLYYKNWSAGMKADLEDAVQALFAGKPLGIADPPPLAYTPTGDEYITTQLSEDVAWPIFIGHVALSIFVEASGYVRWTFAELSGKEMPQFFDSRFFFRWDPSASAYVIASDHGWVTPGDPLAVYDFLVDRDLVAETRLKTIYRVMDWCRAKLMHFGKGLEVSNCQDYWQYAGYPPVKRILEGTLHPNYASDPPRHWTAGCHGTVGFLRAVLRTVNIPVAYIYCGGHAQPHFLHEDLFIPHGDDLYAGYMKAHPAIPISLLPIDKATYEAWFGANVDLLTAQVNIDRRVSELALQFLSDGLLRQHCKDLEAGTPPEDSKVYAGFKSFWTLEELLAMDLWTKMDDKLATLGGCSAVAEKQWTG